MLTLDEWLAEYARAWESGDDAACTELFSEDASYALGPFLAPHVGREAIAKYWRDVATYQKDSKVTVTMLSHLGDVGIAHVRAAFFDTQVSQRLAVDGVLILAIGADGRCTDLRGWWAKSPEANDGNGPEALDAERPKDGGEEDG